MESIVAMFAAVSLVLSLLVLVFFGMLTAFMLTTLYVFYVQRRNSAFERSKKDYHQSAGKLPVQRCIRR